MFSKLLDRSPERYIPYVGHIAPQTVLLLDGSVMAMMHLRGLGYELADARTRMSRTTVLNGLLQYVGDDNVVLYSHLVRHLVPLPDFDGAAPWLSDFARELQHEYREKVIGQTRRNDWFISVVVRPANAPGTGFIRKAQSSPSLTFHPDQVRQLEDAMAGLMSGLEAYSPRRLGYRDAPTDIEGHPIRFTEIGEALHLIRTGFEAKVPEPTGPLFEALYYQRTRFWKRAFDLGYEARPRIGTMLTLRSYPNRKRAGMLNALLSAPFDCTMTHSFAYLLAQKTEASMRLQRRRMESLGDPAVSLQESLKKSLDSAASGHVAIGMHNFSLAVFEDVEDLRHDVIENGMAALDRDVGRAMKMLTEFGGATPMREGLGQETAYFAQLPGNTWLQTRPGKINTDDLASMCSLESIPPGKSEGYWGPAITLFRTVNGTAYQFIPTVDDVGHTIFLGRSGSGKTALANFLLTSIERAMGWDGIRIILDKDAGAKLAVELSGGRYLHLRRGRPSGLAPLRGLPNTAATHAFLFNQFRGLIQTDSRGPIEPDEEERMHRGISRQMEMPVHLRTMAGVREFMGFRRNGAGDRFETWCRGGAMGWLLDNDEHLVDFHSPVAARLYGFDLTELLPKDEDLVNDGACAAAAAVIIHQVRGMMDGRRIVAFCDECRFYLDAIGSVLEDLAVTGRKSELMLWLAAQTPGHFLDHPRGKSLISQAQIKIIFPDASADVQAYVEGMKLSKAAAQQIVRGMLRDGNKRRFLLWREEDPVVCEFDLSSMPDAIAVLSGRAGTVRLLDRITEQAGDDPVERLRLFRAHRHELVEV